MYPVGAPGITDRSSIVYISQDEIVGEENPVENFENIFFRKRTACGWSTPGISPSAWTAGCSLRPSPAYSARRSG